MVLTVDTKSRKSRGGEDIDKSPMESIEKEGAKNV